MAFQPPAGWFRDRCAGTATIGGRVAGARAGAQDPVARPITWALVRSHYVNAEFGRLSEASLRRKPPPSPLGTGNSKDTAKRHQTQRHGRKTRYYSHLRRL